LMVIVWRADGTEVSFLSYDPNFPLVDEPLIQIGF
jgi:hypothetical protein